MGDRPGTSSADSSDDPTVWLVSVALRQDRESFVRLFECYAPKIKALYLRLGASDEAAEEMAQDAMLLIWRKADRFDPTRTTVRGWIYTVARNSRIDHLRRDRTIGDLDQSLRPDDPVTPEEAICATESDTRLHAALLDLPGDQREVMRLAYFENCSQSQIAERLNLPLGTVKSRARRAAARLRAMLSTPS